VLYPEKPRLTTSNRRISSKAENFQLVLSFHLPGYMNCLTSLQSTLERETSRGFRRSLEEGVTKQDDLRIGNLYHQVQLVNCPVRKYAKLEFMTKHLTAITDSEYRGTRLSFLSGGLW